MFEINHCFSLNLQDFFTLLMYFYIQKKGLIIEDNILDHYSSNQPLWKIKYSDPNLARKHLQITLPSSY